MNKMMKKKIVIFLSLLLAVVNFAGLGFGINVKAAEVNYEYKGYETYLYIEGDDVEITKYNLEDGSVSNTVSPEEIYSWGRVSALLVYTSVMQLYEQEKIDLDASIMEYMPDYFKQNVRFSSDFTVRQLLNHQAGFQDVYYYKYTNNPADLMDLEDFIVNCVPDQIYMPGTTVAYSDYGVCLLAYMVENVSDMNFDTYARTNIFDELGMSNTSARANHGDNQYIADLYTGSKYYSYQSEYGMPYYSTMYPALSVVGTMQDMAVFGNALVNGDLFEKEATKEEFFTPGVFYLDGETPRIASGMAVFKYGDNNEIYGTVGTGIVSRSGMLLNVKDKSVICMASNQYAVNDYWNEYVTGKYGEMSEPVTDYPQGISGRYVRSITVTSGKLSFLGLLDTFRIDPAQGKPVSFLANNDLYCVDGIQGKSYTESGNTSMQFAYYDILPYSSAMFTFKIAVLILMGIAYIYAMISLPIGAFIFLKRKFSGDGSKAPIFRKYFYIQSAVIFFYFMFFLSMCSSAMSSGSPTFTTVVSFTYYLGIVASFVYLVFLIKTGRKEECSVFEKGNYYVNAVNAVIVIIFTIIYKLFLF